MIEMRSTIVRYLSELHGEQSANRERSVAEFIPELAHVDPDSFGISIMTVDGHAYDVGDGDLPFTIESKSKPFTYALADYGPAHVESHIDAKPSGDPFNEKKP